MNTHLSKVKKHPQSKKEKKEIRAIENQNSSKEDTLANEAGGRKIYKHKFKKKLQDKEKIEL